MAAIAARKTRLRPGSRPSCRRARANIRRWAIQKRPAGGRARVDNQHGDGDGEPAVAQGEQPTRALAGTFVVLAGLAPAARGRSLLAGGARWPGCLLNGS